LIFGIISLTYIFFFTGIPAAILGIVGITSKNPRGRGMAIAGLIMGVLGFAFFFLIG